jgi:hypothetical protein
LNVPANRLKIEIRKSKSASPNKKKYNGKLLIITVESYIIMFAL